MSSIFSYEEIFSNCKDPDELRLQKYYWCMESLAKDYCSGRVCDQCSVEKTFNKCMEVLS